MEGLLSQEPSLQEEPTALLWVLLLLVLSMILLDMVMDIVEFTPQVEPLLLMDLSEPPLELSITSKREELIERWLTPSLY